MTTYKASNATIEVSLDGQQWQRLAQWDQPAHPTARAAIERALAGGFVYAAALSTIPWVQEQAAAATRAEEEKVRRSFMLGAEIGSGIIGGFSLGVTRFNRGYFDALYGLHTRHAIRFRKIRQYSRIGLDKMHNKLL